MPRSLRSRQGKLRRRSAGTPKVGSEPSTSFLPEHATSPSTVVAVMRLRRMAIGQIVSEEMLMMRWQKAPGPEGLALALDWRPLTESFTIHNRNRKVLGGLGMLVSLESVIEIEG